MLFFHCVEIGHNNKHSKTRERPENTDKPQANCVALVTIKNIRKNYSSLPLRTPGRKNLKRPTCLQIGTFNHFAPNLRYRPGQHKFQSRRTDCSSIPECWEAFDSVWHEGLFFKMDKLNIPINIIRLVDSLSHRFLPSELTTCSQPITVSTLAFHQM